MNDGEDRNLNSVCDCQAKRKDRFCFTQLIHLNIVIVLDMKAKHLRFEPKLLSIRSLHSPFFLLLSIYSAHKPSKDTLPFNPNNSTILHGILCSLLGPAILSASQLKLGTVQTMNPQTHIYLKANCSATQTLAGRPIVK